MTSVTRSSEVLRNRVQFALGWIVFVGALAAAVAMIFLIPATNTLGDRLGFTVVACFTAWFAWLVGINSKIVIEPERVVVVNWFRQYVMPYSSIESISADNGVQISLRNGWTVRPSSGGSSLASAVRGNRLQKRIAHELRLSRTRASSVEGLSAPERKYNVRLGLLLLLMAVLVGITIGEYYVAR